MEQHRLKTLYLTTAHSWLVTYLGFKHDNRKNSYFSNKHDEQKEDRMAFIETYIKRDIQKYKWAHIFKDAAKQRKELDNIPFYEYTAADGTRMREHHLYAYRELLTSFVSQGNQELHDGTSQFEGKSDR